MRTRYSQRKKLRIDVLKKFGYYSTESNAPPQRVSALVRKRGEMEKWRNPNSWLAGDIAGGYYKIAVEYRKNLTMNFEAARRTGQGSRHAQAQRKSMLIHHWKLWSRRSIEELQCPQSRPDSQSAGLKRHRIPGYVDATGINSPSLAICPLALCGDLRSQHPRTGMGVEAAVSGTRSSSTSHAPRSMISAVCTAPRHGR